MLPERRPRSIIRTVGISRGNHEWDGQRFSVFFIPAFQATFLYHSRFSTWAWEPGVLALGGRTGPDTASVNPCDREVWATHQPDPTGLAA